MQTIRGVISFISRLANSYLKYLTFDENYLQLTVHRSENMIYTCTIMQINAIFRFCLYVHHKVLILNAYYVLSSYGLPSLLPSFNVSKNLNCK